MNNRIVSLKHNYQYLHFNIENLLEEINGVTDYY
jgi:hypothetical protein